jgi:hypothetical protein
MGSRWGCSFAKFACAVGCHPALVAFATCCSFFCLVFVFRCSWLTMFVARVPVCMFVLYSCLLMKHVPRHVLGKKKTTGKLPSSESN